MIPLSPALRRFIDQMLCCFVAGPTNIDATASYTMGDLTLSDDLTVAGAFTRQTVAQPIWRTGTETLVGGTLAVAGTWVTAGTTIQLTYVAGAVVADAPAYTLNAGVGFTIFGVGTNVVAWHAATPQA